MKYKINNYIINCASFVDAVKIYKNVLSVKDSDALKRLAYEFAQMGNYFDRANSINSRQILGRNDEQKYAQFKQLGLNVKQQLEKEVAASNKTEKYEKHYNNETLKLLKDGIHALYWTAIDMHDQMGLTLSKKLDELTKAYKESIYTDSIKDVWNKFANETDVSFLKEAIAEMKRYERNWSFMTAKEKQNVHPEGLTGLRQELKFAEDRLKELEMKKDSVEDATQHLIPKGTKVRMMNAQPYGYGHADKLIQGIKEIVLPYDVKGDLKQIREQCGDLMNKQYPTKVGFWIWAMDFDVRRFALKQQDSVADSTRQDIINQIRSAYIAERETWEYGNEHKGWFAQIQNPGSSIYADITKYPHASPKQVSRAWGRIWYDGVLQKSLEGPLNVVRSKMIEYLSSQMKDSVNDVDASFLNRVRDILKKVSARTVFDLANRPVRNPGREALLYFNKDDGINDIIARYSRMTKEQILRDLDEWSVPAMYIRKLQDSVDDSVEEFESGKLTTPRGTFRIYSKSWNDFENEDDRRDWGLWFDHIDGGSYYRIMHNSKTQHAIAVKVR